MSIEELVVGGVMVSLLVLHQLATLKPAHKHDNRIANKAREARLAAKGIKITSTGFIQPK